MIYYLAEEIYLLETTNDRAGEVHARAVCQEHSYEDLGIRPSPNLPNGLCLHHLRRVAVWKCEDVPPNWMILARLEWNQPSPPTIEDFNHLETRP